jgi:AcrR family transcriptional regulator
MPPKKGNPNRRGVARREQILEAAVELFAQRGFRGSGLQELAERVGVSHVAILHHFGSKENLLRAVMAHRDETQAALVGQWQQGGLQALTDAEHGSSLVEPSVLTRLWIVMLAESLTLESPLHHYFDERFQWVRALIAADIRAGQDRGEFRSDVDPDVKAVEIMGFMIGVQTQWLLNPDLIDLDKVFSSFGRRLMNDLIQADEPVRRHQPAGPTTKSSKRAAKR